VRGFSALRAGLCTLPLAVTTLVFAPLSGRLVGARGPRIPLLTAGVAMGAGALMLVELRADTALVWVLASYAVFGFGFAMVNAPITNTAMAGMPREQAGVAAAVASTSRQIGTALGVAVLGSILNAGLAGPLRTGFAAASHPAWWIVAGCGLAVLGVGALTTGPWAVASADRTARLFAEDQRLARAAA